MKRIFIAIVAFLLTLIASAQDWTFTSADNVNPVVTVWAITGYGDTGSGYVINYQYGVDDFQNATEYADKWTWKKETILGWTDTGYIWNTELFESAGNTLTISEAPMDVWVEGAIPDYLGYEDYGALPSGAYWFDISPSGYAFRISTILPSDFGKWAWDGSINPSWVEPPLAPVQQGKRLAKGHNK